MPFPAAEESLGTEFQRCAARAQNRAAVRREQSLQNLAMADGRYVIFSKAARKNIPQSVIDLIRCVCVFKQTSCGRLAGMLTIL